MKWQETGDKVGGCILLSVVNDGRRGANLLCRAILPIGDESAVPAKRMLSGNVPFIEAVEHIAVPEV